MEFWIGDEPCGQSPMGGQTWWVVVGWKWNKSVEAPMRVRFMRRSIGWSIIKFNGRLEKGKKPGQVVEMHNGPGEMMVKGSSLCVIHGSLLAMRYGMKTTLNTQNAAEWCIN